MSSRPHDDRTSARPPDVSVERLHAQLQAGIAALESGDDWRGWLNFAHRLHAYSFNNLILIWNQRPDATAVASYRTWQALHRQVRRGERALRVMAPMVRRAVEHDPEGSIVLDTVGTPRRRQQVIGFLPAAVFDVSQTDGPPLPERRRPTLLRGSAPAGLWEALEREVGERGYRLLRGRIDELDGANGITKVRSREVWVRDDIDDAQAVKTLAHEVAHVILHAESTDPPATSCAGIREVEAESVAHILLAAHGMVTDDYSFPYVATWAYPLAAVEHVPLTEIVGRTGTRVMNAARELISSTTPPAEAQTWSEVAQMARADQGARRTTQLLERAGSSEPTSSDRAVLIGVLADSQEYFRQAARNSWVPDYLRSRGIGDATETNGVGYAPRRWTALTDHLRSLGYSDHHIEAAGVASRSRTGHLIDHLRERLTVPLRDERREIVGFTGRIDPARSGRVDEPKYLNTRTTALFRKSEILFGLAEHVEQLRTGWTPVVCEGPFDAMSIDRLASIRGLEVVGLASAGTAFTVAHSRQLEAVSGDRTVCLAFDGDAAGLAATEKAWALLTQDKPRSVVAADLPSGSDPAALLVSAPHLLEAHLHGARPAASVLAERKIAGAQLGDDAGRELLAFRELADLAGRMPLSERAPYLLHVAELLHIDVGEAAADLGERHPELLEERAAGPRADGCAALQAVLCRSTDRRTTELGACVAADRVARLMSPR